MLKFDVYGEEMSRKSGRCEAVSVPTWLDVSDVFAVRADADPEWAVLSFKPGAGPSKLIVRGEADAVAALITAEQRARP